MQHSPPADPLFPTRTGRHLSRDAIEHRISRYRTLAVEACPSMKTKHLTMHTLRHSAAMRLLEAGVDVTVIALWLGHEQPATTANIYLHADMTQKEQPSHAWPRRGPPPAATSLPTRCWRSSKPSDYADLRSRDHCDLRPRSA